MFAFYFALYTWLDFALSHFAFYNCPRSPATRTDVR